MAEKMEAIVLRDVGTFEYCEVDKPGIKKPDDVLLKVEAASICGTDVHILATPPSYPGTKGIVLGHEFVGTVAEVGSAVGEFKVGDRVVLDPNIYCGSCFQCQKGNFNMCCNVEVLGTTIDGGFTEYCVAPQKMLVKIAPGLSAEQAIFVEPLTCVVNAVNKVRLLPGETVLINGAASIGLYFLQLFKANGAGKILVSEVSASRREFAEKCGATRTIDPSKENLLDVVREETGGHGVDVVVDAVGFLIEECIQCCRAKGSIVLFGMCGGRQMPVTQFDVVRKELSIYGSFIGLNTLPATVSILESGLIDFTPMITHRLPLRDFHIGLEAMRDGSALEVVLYPGKR